MSDVFLLFIDDYSRFSWLYLLKTKDEALSIFLQFKNLVENQFDAKIKILQTDWGGEGRFVSTFLASRGISHRVSCPYTLQQNGWVERKNRHVVEMGLTMLVHSRVPMSYRPFAFQSTVHIINRLPTSILNFKSPFEIIFLGNSWLQFLQNFGSAYFPCFWSYNSHKL